MNYEPNIIMAAARFAKEKHEGQIRKYANPPVPYIVHPMRVAGRVMLLPGSTAEMVAAAWLHDVLEDCDCDYDELAENFGHYISSLVLGLTDISKQDPAIGKLDRAARKEKNNEYLLRQPLIVQMIKLCDILDNITDMAHCKDGFKFKFFREKRIQARLLSSSCPELANEIEVFLESQLNEGYTRQKVKIG
jgi:(p)ppGpp synthase/HD superfamily hydrolase